MPTDLILHYDLLIDENNDPVHDPAPLQAYMDRWDGPVFLEMLELDAVLDMGTRKIERFPDTPDEIRACISAARLKLTAQTETESAHIFTAEIF